VDSFQDGEVIPLGGVDKNASLVMKDGRVDYYSPRSGIIIITLSIFEEDGVTLPVRPIQIYSNPGKNFQELQNIHGDVKIEIPSQQGLNIIEFPSRSLVIQIKNIQ